ncbi:MAG: glyoxylase family protein [Thermoleophilaceae bacterium]|jgi:glyoxalase family protein|nr:glyoxylase family protein [Thermoleophilaceae bacterium]
MVTLLSGPSEQQRRLQIRGLHHVTMLVENVDRSAAFYGEVLGFRVVKRTVNADDPNARHFFFSADAAGSPGSVVSCMEYPEMEQGHVGRGSIHHFALAVASKEELEGWRQYLESRGVSATEVHDRTYFSSIYVRDPDQNLVEIACRNPGFTADEPEESLGQRLITPP